ncbi:MAG: hypothetical protein JWP10_1131 [Nocardioidaceae bacterium]|nr:hypothetical protein [Nocardioidaceae bacterium]
MKTVAKVPTRQRRPLRAASLVIGFALLLGGCVVGGSEDDGGLKPGGPDPAATSLTIVTDGVSRTLTCDPPTGSHPDPAAACAALIKTEASVFEAVPADRMCTAIFGGPQVAKVTGTLDGKEIDASFSRTNGCEIARWDALGDAFFVPNLPSNT